MKRFAPVTTVLAGRKKFLLACVGVCLVGSAHAAPVYIGLQDGTGAIQTVASGGSPQSLPQTQVGTSGVYVTVNATGTPPLPEPDLLSNSLEVSGSHNPGGTISVYISELNMEVQPVITNFASFFSNFATSIPTDWDGFTTNAVTSVTLSTYAQTCAVVVVNVGCTAADAFAEGNLLSTATFTPTGGSIDDVAQIPAGLTTPFSLTEVYTVTFGAGYGDVSSSIDVSVPEPFSLAILGTGLIGLGVARRKRMI